MRAHRGAVPEKLLQMLDGNPVLLKDPVHHLLGEVAVAAGGALDGAEKEGPAEVGALPLQPLAYLDEPRMAEPSFQG